MGELRLEVVTLAPFVVPGALRVIGAGAGRGRRVPADAAGHPREALPCRPNPQLRTCMSHLLLGAWGFRRRHSSSP
jgi:hypothetical protein